MDNWRLTSKNHGYSCWYSWVCGNPCMDMLWILGPGFAQNLRNGWSWVKRSGNPIQKDLQRTNNNALEFQAMNATQRPSRCCVRRDWKATAAVFSNITSFNCDCFLRLRSVGMADKIQSGSDIEVRPLDQALNGQLLNTFRGERTGYVRAGPQGYLLPASYAQDGHHLRNFKPRPTDTWVVTFPRSG